MTRRSAARRILAAGALSFFPRIAAGVPQTPGDYTIRSEVRLVLLDVAVKDRNGAFVSGLCQDNFSVTEDGRPQTITVFSSADLPVTVGLLVDESRSMRPKRAEVLAAAQTLIQESNPQDEVFVLNFNDEVTRGLPAPVLFSDNINKLRAALYRGIPEGKTALNDAVVTGLQQLDLGRRDRKSLVVISDGGDNASVHKTADMFDRVEKSLATIYAVGIYDPEELERNPGVLRRLARVSGGEAYFPENPSQMTPVCKRIAAEMRTRYTIGYHPESGGHARSLRHVHVSVSAPGHSALAVRARSTYRYE